MLSLKLLHELLGYNPETGIFTWKVSRRGRTWAGKVAGCVNPRGYITLGVCGAQHPAHRVAWLYMHGAWPDGEVDHINGIKTDNRMCNLRVATRIENSRNVGLTSKNKTGIKNVYWHSGHKKYRACIDVDRKEVHLGYFTNLSDAEAVVAEARVKYHGDFACHK